MFHDSHTRQEAALIKSLSENVITDYLNEKSSQKLPSRQYAIAHDEIMMSGIMREHSYTILSIATSSVTTSGREGALL